MNKTSTIIIISAVIISIAIGVIPGILRKSEEKKLAIETEKQALQTELESMKTKMKEIENKKPEVITKTVTIDNTKTVQVKDGFTTEEVIKRWTDKTAFILCGWYYKEDVNLETPYSVASGSGMLTQFNDGSTQIITNAHVLLEDGYAPSICIVEIPGYEKIYVGIKDYSIWKDKDLAYINIKNPTQELINTAYRTDVCKEVNIGEKLVVIGYPSTGSAEGITATEGMISGTDGQYYTTSAKMEHGNSGGLAISLKNNCYIGIPSYAITGSIESLGRILSNKYVFGN